ncbi:hypothetical protein FJ987_05745 [Mesorhizobium sp. CU2]|uniref:hypothetical protein n=1 Tax=unclassified Mesorhizobium TaxID=325217 RepID=UPI0011295939|nr:MULTISPECIES: hypothetical protein [unclassified Mesorhizobium]TPN79568.1 hypothetical protein FJ988_22920 [Mesorhizobium sp. CU3]TPO20041.1 hypothetical protein FJ987_05745 [Mesorhizobium sp. CU2]
MSIAHEQAALSLSEISEAERRTRQALDYGRASDFLILWGIVTGAAFALVQFLPGRANEIWLGADAVGIAASVAIARWPGRRQLCARRDPRLLAAFAVLFCYGIAWSFLFVGVDPRKMAVFWATLMMSGYVMAGLWRGYVLGLCGLAISALAFAGYCLAGAWFPLWMAATYGGGLIAGGLWLRHVGAR